MESPTAFDRNRERLGRRHPALARAIGRAESERLELVRGPSGVLSLRERGVLLASCYDPLREGERLFRAHATPEPDLLVVIGFGLGYAVEAALARERLRVLVWEPSVERLRAALALRSELDWIAAPRLDWAADLEELVARFRAHYRPGFRVRVLVHPAVKRLEPETVQEALRRLARAKDADDITAQTRVLKLEHWSRLTIRNLPHLLRRPSLSRLFDVFRGMPAVVAAAGPSLDRQLPLLARHRERLLVIAIGQTLGALRRAGIEPDLVHIVESKDVRHQIERGGGPGGVHLVLLPSVHPGLFELNVASCFVAYPFPNKVACWIASQLGDTRFVLGGATVAQSAVHVAAALGANPILLIGQDLAFTGGKVYASGSPYEMVSIELLEQGGYRFRNIDAKRNLFGRRASARNGPRSHLVWVEGWGGERVPTSRAYASFIEQYRELGDYFAALGIRLINCTEGGAWLPGIEHRPFARVLAELPARPRDCRAEIDRRAAAKPPAAGRLIEAIGEARRSLERVEREVSRGLRTLEKAEAHLPTTRSPAEQLAWLQRVARAERAVQRRLGALPWLDALIQPELHRNEAELQRSEGTASADEALGAARRVLEAARRGAEKGWGLLDELDQAARCAATGGDASGRGEAGLGFSGASLRGSPTRG